ncbi:Uncharacterized protein TCM_041063 [Theobroma cacao]|uniref:Uncharacterized protein n=1 Tax=Theobroma cacao TaxID=3641 RepID=A0A061GV53_THECC|nr:Uncharacterized protein TCM_041063 [Theobroma cacao]
MSPTCISSGTSIKVRPQRSVRPKVDVSTNKDNLNFKLAYTCAPIVGCKRAHSELGPMNERPTLNVPNRCEASRQDNKIVDICIKVDNNIMKWINAEAIDNLRNNLFMVVMDTVAVDCEGETADFQEGIGIVVFLAQI